MSMPQEQILFAIDDRLRDRWRQRCIDEMASPACVIAVKQLAGPDEGKVVVCTPHDMPNHLLADLLTAAGEAIKAQGA